MTSLRKTAISTCSISRQFGARTVIPSMQEMLAYMLIIGKTLEESPTFLSMTKSNVLSGRLKTSFRLMLTDASMSIDALTHTDGKNRSTTHQTIRCMPAGNKTRAQSHIALITIQTKIRGWPLVSSLRFSPRIEEWALLSKLRSIKAFS